MRRVSVLIILFGICFLSNNLLYAFDTNQVSEDVGLNSIIEELNEYTEGMNLQDISEDLISGKSIEYDTILKKIAGSVKDSIIPCMKEVLFLLTFIVIVGVMKALELDNDSTITKVANILTVFVIVAYLLVTFGEFADTVKKVVGIQSSIVQIVSPFLMSLLILTGAVTTVGIVEPAILLIVQLISFSVNYVIMPLITVTIVFSIITSISEKIDLEKFGSMCNKTALWINAILLSVFLGVTSLGTSVTTSVDGVTLKATQTAVSGVIPVVGKFVSDSVEFVMGATEIISKTAGVIAVITLIIVMFGPVVKLTITVIVTSFITAVAESINTDKSVVKLLDKFSDVFKTMLGVLISTNVTFIISISIVMSLVGKVIE